MELDKKQFEFIKSLTWDEVVEIWRNNEENEGHWESYYKSKGYKSWEDWRKKYLDAYTSLNKKWYLVKVKDPMTSVPKFRGGNHKGWKDSFYECLEMPTFSEMKENPVASEFLKNHSIYSFSFSICGFPLALFFEKIIINSFCNLN